MQALGQVSELVFIPGNGPVLTSKAYLATRLDARHSDSLFAALPLAQRLAFNNAIIRNSLAQAIATKNRNLANQTAAFSQRTWNNNCQRGLTAYESNMLAIYQAHPGHRQLPARGPDALRPHQHQRLGRLGAQGRGRPAGPAAAGAIDGSAGAGQLAS